ncbi:MAG: MFS transporter [Pseudomonadota bacterium]
MLRVFVSAWALLLGIGLLMVGNGLQATLMGVRGSLENFSTLELSVITSAYFLGFLGGSRLSPEMIRRVGHVRVFAALGSFVSAALILFPTITEPWAWTILRIVVGFCFSGIYVTAESWLNNTADNTTRGQTLSLYVVMQMSGVVAAQVILAYGDISGFVIFIIPSVLVSISFAPILLSVSPTPPFATTKPMKLRELFRASPLTFVGMTLLGGVFATIFGMSSVYASQVGLSVGQLSTFVAAFFVGPLVLQFPVGWISDRMDRRRLIFIVALIGGTAALVAYALGDVYLVLLAVALLVGGTANPLYSLLIAYINDYLETDDMAAASGGLLFVNGVGAVTGPIIIGWAMGAFGTAAFWLFTAALMLSISAYALYRMTQRPSIPVDETAAYLGVSPSSTSVLVEAAQEWAQEQSEVSEEQSAT